MNAQAEGRKGRRIDRRVFLAALGLGAVGAAVTAEFDSPKLAAIRPGKVRQGPLERVAPLMLSAQSYDFRDFTEPTSGQTCALLAGGIIGKGSDRTFIDLTGPIKTDFPPYELGDTTRFNVIRIQSTVGRLSHPVLSGFTLRVSAPAIAGQLFNGLRISATDGLLLEDVVVLGIPGTGNQPPFETFGIDLLDCKRPMLRRVRVDGQGLGAAGIGLNLVSDATVDSCTASHNSFSHGFTCYQCSGVRFVDCLSTDNGSGTASGSGVGFNHEETFRTEHVNSRSTGNSLASYRYWAANRTTTGHQILRSFGDGAVLVQGDQSAKDISIRQSHIPAGIVRD